MTVRPTYEPTRGREYRRPGGWWDVPTLDRLLLDGEVTAHARVIDDGDGSGPHVVIHPAGLAQMVARAAGGLRARGVRRGDPVAWQLANGLEPLVLFLACWRLGAVAVPIHHRATDEERELRVGPLDPPVTIGSVAEAEALRAGGAAPVTRSASRPSDVAVVLFTAGSSGTPKGVVHTHRTLATKAIQMVAAHALGPADVVLMPAPMAHVSGLLNGVLVPLLAGMTTVLQPAWSPPRALSLLREHGVTFMVGPPTFFVTMADDPSFSADHVASLRLVSTGGAGVTPAFVEDATARFGARFKRSYGSTEAPTITTSSGSDPAERAAHSDGRLLSSGAELGLAADGELLVRGPEVCVGYLDPAHTAAAFQRGGWFRTGDLATLDDGWLTITGRKSDVIIRAGENISAPAVEAVLERHPGVREAAVVGEVDRRLGERVVAFVTGDPAFDLAACRAWFAETGAARFTTPERVVHLDRMPTLPAGKIDKTSLRALL